METISSRIRVARDTTSNWNANLYFVPLLGEIIIYTDHGQIDDGNGNTISVPGIKIGDGSAYLIDLPFVGNDESDQILQELRGHTENTQIHVSQNEKSFWNNKLNCTVENKTLIFNRN